MKKLLVTIPVLVLLGSVSLRAQDLASIVGTVTDPTGAVIPGTKITVANPDTGFSRTLVTNNAGEYTAPKIPIGTYRITGEAAGFKRLVNSNIVLAVGQVLRVDLQLEVGNTAQQVTVTGNAAHVETERPTVSEVVAGTQISQLNLNGRNFMALSVMAPGIAPIPSTDFSQNGVAASISISSNGSRGDVNAYELDGGLFNTDLNNNTNTFINPSLDSIGEFRISTSNYGADIGRRAGAVIEAVTKSGTREFHGDAYEFVRNDAMDGNAWFVNRIIAPLGGNAPKTPLKRNDFGYTFGGPFYIPGHYNSDKSKTFFFWSEEWRRDRVGEVLSASVPTRRMRNGDFGECDPKSGEFNPDVSGCTLPINGTTGQPFAGDIVPIDPNAKALLNGLFPLPNSGVNGWTVAPSIPTNWREEEIRVDQNISEKTRLFVRYMQDAWEQLATPSLWTSSTYDTTSTLVEGPGKSAVINLTHTFNPKLLNELVLSYMPQEIDLYNELGPGSPAGNVDKPSTWTANTIFAQDRRNPLLPSTFVCGGAGFCGGTDTGFGPDQNPGPEGMLKDNLTYLVGKHTLKAGVWFTYSRARIPVGYPETQGTLTFSNTAANTTGNALADMFAGSIASYTEASAAHNGVPTGDNGRYHGAAGDFEQYLQDDFRVSRRLTLNLGVRYYWVILWHSIDNPTNDSNFLASMYDPTKEASINSSGYFVVNQATGQTNTPLTYGNGLVPCGQADVHTGCTLPGRGNVAPRFGFAYDPFGNGKTAIRGGYGVYYDVGNTNNMGAEQGLGNPPSAVSSTIYNVTGYQSFAPGPYGPGSMIAFPPKTKLGSTQQFSFTIEHQFAGNNFVSVGYVGTLGRHLGRGFNMNQIPIGVGTKNVPALAGVPGCDSVGNCDVQTVLINATEPNIFFVPYPGYSTIVLRENTGVSNYNSLQISYRHSMGHGLTMQGAYTYSHNIDDVSNNTTLTVDDTHLSRWRANSALNESQVFQMNYVYDLPFFAHSHSALVRSSVGGWSLSGITSFYTGPPVDFGCSVSGHMSGIGGGLRCNSLGALKIKKGVYNDPEYGPTPSWFDPGTIGQVTQAQLRADNEPGMFGYMGRDALTGPGRNDWDIALLKNIHMPWIGGERSTLQFRLETFNTFNHPQWMTVNAGCGSTTPYGQPCNDLANNRGNGTVSGAFPSRIVQLGMKLVF
jgi:hypothetical protein